MKILLDENLPHGLRHEIPGHNVFTVAYMGWSGVKNGLLLSRAAAEGFEAFVTKDVGVRYQQNPSSVPLAVVVLRAASNDIDDIRPLLSKLLEALAVITPKSVVEVSD